MLGLSRCFPPKVASQTHNISFSFILPSVPGSLPCFYWLCKLNWHAARNCWGAVQATGNNGFQIAVLLCSVVSMRAMRSYCSSPCSFPAWPLCYMSLSLSAVFPVIYQMSLSNKAENTLEISLSIEKHACGYSHSGGCLSSCMIQSCLIFKNTVS